MYILNDSAVPFPGIYPRKNLAKMYMEIYFKKFITTLLKITEKIMEII